MISTKTDPVRARDLNSIKVVAVSGGFDPLHPGHIDYLEAASRLGDRLVVILTRDDQLIKKKGYVALPFEVRKAVLQWGLRSATVLSNRDSDITSCLSLEIYHHTYGINVFAKGGDTWNGNNLPEKEVCERLGIEIIYGVGGYDKPFSSSKLI